MYICELIKIIQKTTHQQPDNNNDDDDEAMDGRWNRHDEKKMKHALIQPPGY